MGFDADAYRRARVPWTLTLDGTTYTATWVSVEVMRRFHESREAVKDSEEGLRAAVRALLREAFPRRVHYRWRGDPVDKLLALETPVLVAALTDFFAWWGARSQLPGTNGTGSATSTGTPSPTPTSPP